MSLQAEVIDYVGEVHDKKGNPKDRVVIEIDKQKEYDYNPGVTGVGVAHDYVAFTTDIGIQQRQSGPSWGDYPMKDVKGAINWISVRGTIQIDIREMYDVILPMLNKHKYLQAEHFAEIEHKGEKYPAYAYNGSIIQWYDKENSKSMVTFKRCGEDVWETLTLDLFNTIKHTLKLGLSKKSLAELETEK